MTRQDLTALLPLLTMAASAVAVLMLLSFLRSHRAVFLAAVAGILLSAAAMVPAAAEAPRVVAGLLVVDTFALLLMGFLLACTLAVAALSYGYIQECPGNREEFHFLLLLVAFGAMVLACSAHFATLFLGLEILTVGLYVLIAYLPGSRRTVEAGLKYLVLAAASSAFLLFGMALVYAERGTMEFAALASPPALGEAPAGALLAAGGALMLVGVAFKLALAPFHMWTADVYAGAPAPVTAFVATVSKGGMFAVFLRFYTELAVLEIGALQAALAVLAIASMAAGNLLALFQDNVKRMLAWSSVAHLGYLMVAVLAGGALAAEAATFYLAAYMATALASFGVVTVLSTHVEEAESIEAYRGLFWRRPLLAALFTTALLSLAGIPLTAGFLAKFYVLAAGLGAALWAAVAVLVAGSAVGLFYYLRVVVAMLSEPRGAAAAPAPPAPSTSPLRPEAAATLAALAAAVLFLGVHPTPLLTLISGAVAGLGG